MYPGGNNYNPNYPNQQGYNAPPQPYGAVPGYPAGQGIPPTGFNVQGGMNQAPGFAPGYGPPQQAPYGMCNQFPGNPQPYMQPNPGYPGGQPSYSPQGPFMPGNPGSQYPAAQCAPSNPQGYGNMYPQMQGQQGPQYNQGPPMAAPVYGNAYPQASPQKAPGNLQQFSPIANPNHPVECIGSGGETYRGTIKPYPNFNAEQDCNVLKKAMKGLGTDEKAIIECLGRRNLSQRLEIKRTFKTCFGKDLIDELKSEIGGNLSRAVIESLYDSDYYDAYSLHKAMEGAGTREDVLTEILTSRSNKQIESIKELYKKWFNKNLEKEVISETSGFYKRVLVSCLQANKKELTADELSRLRQQGPSAVVNINQARQEAQELYNAGEKKIGTDEAAFIKIFATRNKFQLRATFDEYHRLSGRDIIASIEREMSGDLSGALKAIAMQAVNPPSYFASRLYQALHGAGTNDTALIRILITRSEVDMENIKVEFQKLYGKTLDSFIRGDASGDYLKYLLRFVEGN